MKRIKELLTRRILLEAGAWIAGTALYAIEGIIRWPI